MSLYKKAGIKFIWIKTVYHSKCDLLLFKPLKPKPVFIYTSNKGNISRGSDPCEFQYSKGQSS